MVEMVEQFGGIHLVIVTGWWWEPWEQG
jgi:hypothetical protein